MTTEVVLASRFKRLVATLIDAVLVPTLTIFLVMVFGVVEHAEDFADSYWMLHVLFLAVASYLVLNGYWLIRRGQTVGKRVMGIALRSVDGKKLNFWRYVFLRGVFFALMFTIVYPFTALFPLIDHLLIFSKQRRCLHDYAAGTIVVSCR